MPKGFNAAVWSPQCCQKRLQAYKTVRVVPAPAAATKKEQSCPK